MKLTRRRALTLASACAGVLLIAPDGRTAVPVFDLGRFTQMIQQLQELARLRRQLEAGLSALQDASRRLGEGRPVVDILLDYRSIMNDVNSIGYHIDTVTRQFYRVFPDARAVRNTRPGDVRDLSRGWDHEIHQSSLAASRAQTTLSTIETNTAAVQDVLGRSERGVGRSARGSHLAKLQALVQMIRVVNSDLGALATTLAATERVNAALAGADATEQEVITERRRRLLIGYTRRSRAGGLDRRFLRSR